MADELFNRGGGLSDDAIKGIIDEEITSHKRDQVALPKIKLTLPSKQSTLEIHKAPPKPKLDLEKPAAPVMSAGALKTRLDQTVRLPDSLTSSQKLKKAFRYRRFGMPIREVKKIRPVTPMPVVKKEDRKKYQALRFRKSIIGAELILPAFLIFLVFSWMPIINTFSISFTKFETMSKAVPVGLENFQRLIADPEFWNALKNSSIMTLIIIVIGTWLPFFLSLYIYEMRRAATMVKVMYFIPFLIPAVPAAILWKWIYNQGFGLINSVLSIVSGADVNIGWLTDPNVVLFSIALVFVWKNTGWAILIYIAGLHNIDKTLFEDASLNGASLWVKIREIVMPAMIPIILTVVFIQIISGLQVFTEVYIMTNGGPQNASEVIATFIYKKAFLYMDIGYAACTAVFFLFLLVTVTLTRAGILKGRA